MRKRGRREGWTLVMASLDLTAVLAWLCQTSGQNAKLFRDSLYYFHSFFFFACACGIQESLTRDQTHASCTESVDVYHWLRITGSPGKPLFRHSWAWALTELLLHLNRFCRESQMIKFSSGTRKSRFWCTWFHNPRFIYSVCRSFGRFFCRKFTNSILSLIRFTWLNYP